MNTRKEEKKQVCLLVAQLVKTLPPKTNYAQQVKDNLASRSITVKLSTIYQVGCGNCYHEAIIQEIVSVVKATHERHKQVNSMLQQALQLA